MKALGLVMALLVPLAAGCVAEAIEPSKDAGAVESSSEAEEIVRDAYRRLEDLVRASDGGDLHFALEDFRTVDRRELNETPWGDLATIAGGATIRVHRGTMTYLVENEPEKTERRVRYEASWDETASDYPESSYADKLTVEQILSHGGLGIPSYDEIRAATTYAVRATLGERTRSYRAVVLWGLGDFDEAEAHFLDSITQGGFPQALVEELEPETSAEPISPGQTRTIVVNE